MHAKIRMAIEEHVRAGSKVEDMEGLIGRLEVMLKPKGLSFPCEYGGWKVEIKMGHEFKGTRGSTRRSRGYVATCIATKEVQEFPPSAGNSVGFTTVKQWVDLKNHMEAKLSAK